jgi:hypothetical protein
MSRTLSDPENHLDIEVILFPNHFYIDVILIPASFSRSAAGEAAMPGIFSLRRGWQ